MKNLTFLITLLSFSSINAYSQQIDREKINNYINYIEDNNGGFGSLSIFKDGKEVYNRSFGQVRLLNVNHSNICIALI